MTPALIALLCGLTVLTVWGVVAPRGQWRALAGWTRRDPYASEPGPVSVAVHRLVAILATVGLVLAGGILWVQYEKTLPKPPKPISAIEQMWGAPDPVVLNRVVNGSTEQPTNLVVQPLLRYQALDGFRRSPAYLFDLKSWALTTPQLDGGIVGSAPSPGLSALDSASIVVQVHGDSECVPRAVYVLEGSTAISIAVYYGRPGAATSTATDCRPVPPASSALSVLVPIYLADPVGKRTVKNLDGSLVPVAPDLTK
ncbi:MAG: hypothetical protein JWN80_2927 [Microbacteriaceae bacterium]|nr:hypothetical protein [Microbacteriaceae bacterium]